MIRQPGIIKKQGKASKRDRERYQHLSVEEKNKKYVKISQKVKNKS